MDDKAFVSMDDRHLERFGENTARVLRPAGETSGRGVWQETQACLRRLRAVRDRLAAAGEPGPAAEWLLDNWYLAQREGMAAAEAFRRARRLRWVQREGRQPVVLELARAFLWAAGPDPGPDRLAAFLRGSQSALPLTESELALLVPALKCALAERVERLSRGLEGQEQEGEALAQGMGRAFTALRTLANAELSRLLEEASLVEQILRKDPAGAYAGMDEASRSRYRAQVCRLARRWDLSEPEAARRVVDRAAQGREGARHVGRYLFPQRPPAWIEGVYMGGVVLVTLFAALLLGYWLNAAWAALLLVLPVSDIVKNCADFLAVRLSRPRHVHRMALEEGIPAQGKTLCVIACLLTGEDSGGELAGLLERYRLANRDAGPELKLGLLADLPDGDRPMGREGQTRVEAARRAVEALNETYGGGFYLFFRPPVFHAPDQRYMGWERKRGALLELARLLRGRSRGLRVEAGDRGELDGVKYVITLDSDTCLTVGSARELAGAMLHPLNRPEVDPRRRVVTAGYGLLQPRISVDLESANRSQFSRIFAGQGGVDPYGSASSDVYHDLFDQATYTGKGIFDVDVFLACLDNRLPNNAVLSHDLLEGSYLRAGLLGDVELTDGYPSRPTAYFSRLHRWVRGDWQLLPWLGRRVRDERGEKRPNPLGTAARWKIADNLRRSLSPIFSMLALILGMCLDGPVFTAAAGVAVLSAWSNLLLSGADLAFRRGGGWGERYHATIITGFGGTLLQTMVQLLFLPYQAWICATAALTALWRMGVSRRGLLAWTTAAEAERRGGDGLWAYLRAMWPGGAIGLGCILGSRVPLGGAAGLVWLASPLLGWLMGRPIPTGRAAPEEDRPFLLHQAALIWRYFEDFLRPQDHYLPPDNYQEHPDLGLARRTSPTNIGMALLCCLAAVDLDLTGRPRAEALIGHMLDTLEALPKWRGHCYNWYDTASAQPLEPRYVSTVDGGNLCGSLIALAAGVEEWGRADLAARARALADAMDFSLLYDRSRKLFYIGYDCAKEAYTQGWYDLMASEARQTSYLAVARGEVSPRHWRRLSRALVGQDHYRGMASWTGTMFEYFMPHLLLPAYENSLLYESLAFCLYAQKKRVRGTGAPWGISESAFYAFDGGLNYQYKAHGVQRLGLKRGLDRELVVAPYAAFLALALAPRSAVRDLRRMGELGLEGPYGLYEAADFTPARRVGGQPFEPVRSYMAHHLGMSLVAVDNALTDHVMQRRFFRDRAMSAYRELLQEKVPVGAQVMKTAGGEAPALPPRPAGEGLIRTGEGYDPLRPTCHLLSGGAWKVLCTDAGAVRSQMGRTALTRCLFQRQCAPSGVSFFLRTGEGLFPLTAAPLYRTGPEYAWQFRQREARWTARWRGWETSLSLTLPRQENGEVWEVRIRGDRSRTCRGELVCYLEPVLAPMEDYEAHPAFSKLSIESRALGDGVLFQRRPRRQGESRPSLAVLWDGEAAAWDTSREAALGRGGLTVLDRALDRPAGGTVGGVLDPCLLVRFPLTLEPGREGVVRLALSAADRGDRAADGALRLLCLPRSGEAWPGAELTREETLQAYQLLRWLQFPGREWVRRGSPEQAALWPFGISGDLPLLVCPVEDPEGAETGLLLGRIHQFLSRMGAPFELVLLLDEGGDYRRPLARRLEEGLREAGWASALGSRAGIFLVERAGRAVDGILRAGLLWGGDMGPGPGLEPAAPPRGPWEPGLPPFGFPEEGGFTFQCGPRLPPVGWSMVLANPHFGWRTDETGGGHLWLENARENPLTEWRNDPLAVGGPEGVFFRRQGEEISFFAALDGRDCRVTYRPGLARWDKGALSCTAFVPQAERARYLCLTAAEPGTVVYRRAGAPDQEWPIRDRLILRTAPGRSGPETAAAPDWDRVMDLERETLALWARWTSALVFRTPDRDLDRYLNGWALYQTAACRLFARTSLYQNGGAYGFRDQLQDVCALLLTAPELARAQILRACAHQYREGDVQHWWHPTPEGAGEKGVRTRISDDLLWLPYALCRYTEVTGDRTILAEEVPFLVSQPLEPGERERYECPGVSPEGAPAAEHARRALRLALDRGTGAHGLARMGTGDWNDGMDLVGAGGQGESVWLTWFLALVLEDFASLTGEEAWREEAGSLIRAAEAAWDGDWFLRGRYDDGGSLGSRKDPACRIDSIAQSFAALVPGVDREKAERGVRSALELLFDRDHSLVKLFTPPFDGGDRDPGYVQGYLPGVRENGGQYTHAGVWLALACFRLGWPEEGAAVLHALLPTAHDPAVYRAEPYVLAADVYAAPGHMERGGWSWYTGAAGWYYRTAVEELLGIKVRAGQLTLAPCLPRDWTGFRLEWAGLEIRVERTGRPGLLMDGRPHSGPIPLKGTHWVLFSI